jgi:hypothetical protein
VLHISLLVFCCLASVSPPPGARWASATFSLFFLMLVTLGATRGPRRRPKWHGNDCRVWASGRPSVRPAMRTTWIQLHIMAEWPTWQCLATCQMPRSFFFPLRSRCPGAADENGEQRNCRGMGRLVIGLITILGCLYYR